MVKRVGLKVWAGVGAAGLLAVSPAASRAQISPATLPDLKLFTGGRVNAIAVQSDRKVIVGGLFTSINGVPCRNLARINPDGSVDPTWNPAPDGVVYSLAVTEGAVFVGGTFTSIGGQARQSLAKVELADSGAADPVWDPASDRSATVIYTMTVSGVFLYVGGLFEIIGGQKGSSIARLGIGGVGTADPNWNPDANGAVNAIIVDGPDVYVGGDFTVIGRRARDHLAKLDAGYGQADSTWNPGPDGSVGALAVDENYVYVGGSFSAVGGQSCANLAKVTKNVDMADPVWNPSPDGRVSGIVFSGGNVFAFGEFSYIGGELRNGMAKLGQFDVGIADSAWDALLDENVLQPVAALAVDGAEIYVGGQFHFAGSSLALGFAKLDEQTGEVAAGFPVQVQRPGQVKTMAYQSDGRILIGGDFYLAGDVPRYNVARVELDRTLDMTWSPVANGPVFALASDSTGIFVGGSFTRIGGLVRTNLAKVSLTGPGTPDILWNPNPEGGYVISTLAVGEGSLYVGGTFTRISGQVRRNLAKLSTTSFARADPDWAPDISVELGGEINELDVRDGYVYVAGSFERIGGQPRSTLARLNPGGSGSADVSWDPNPPGPVTAFTIVGDSLYAVSGYQVTRFNTAGPGTPDPLWQATADDYIASVAADETQVYVGGNFQTINGQLRRFLARLDAEENGLADPTWARPITDPSAVVAALLAVPNGVYAGGSFTSIGGMPRAGFAFLPEVRPPAILTGPGSLLIQRHPEDGLEVSHFQVAGLTNVSLLLNDGVTPVNAGNFVTVDQARAGLWYFGSGSISIVSALNDTPAGAGTAATVVTVVDNSAESPVQLTVALLPLDGQISIEVRGPTNRVYSVLESSELIPAASPWRELFRLTNYTGSVTFTNGIPATVGPRFYRAKLL